MLSANIHRRHLTAEQKREIIAKVLKAQPDEIESDDRQADQGRSQDGRGGARQAGGDVGKFPTSCTTIEDTKGRQQPTHKTRRDVEDYIAEKKARRAEREIELAQQDHGPAGQTVWRDLCRPGLALRAVFARDRHGSRRRQPLSDDARPRVRAIAVGDRGRSIRAVPVGDGPMLPHALDVMEAWGSTTSRISSGTRTAPARATGFAIGTSFCWSARAARSRTSARHAMESLIVAPAGEHSASQTVRRDDRGLFPTLPKIELYRRGAARPGWDAWGNEVPVLSADGAPTESQESGETFRHVRHDDVAMFDWKAGRQRRRSMAPTTVSIPA